MSEQITNLQRIIKCLHKDRRVCDDCLSKESGVTPRQAVNQLCRKNPQWISQCDDRMCEGQCRKVHKILRFLSPQNGRSIDAHRQAVLGAASDDEDDSPKIDDILDDPKSSMTGGSVRQKIASASFSREKYLHQDFNEIIARALGLPPADYFGRLTVDGLIDLKAITSNIHAMITLKLTVALVDWLQLHLKFTQEEADALKKAADAARPFESGFDLDSLSPNVIAEVKGNIPVKRRPAFGDAQLKGLTNDVLQMFGLPPAGKAVETMSNRSKIHRPDLGSALKFLGVFDSAHVRTAARKWMKTFRKKHAECKVELAEGIATYKPDTVYVVFLSIGLTTKDVSVNN